MADDATHALTDEAELTGGQIYDMLERAILQRDDPVPLLALLHLLGRPEDPPKETHG